MSCRRPRFHLAGVKRTLVSLDSPASIEFTYFSGRERWSVLIVCERSALWTADNKGQDRRAKRFRLARGHLDDGHAFAALLGRGEVEALDQRVLRQKLAHGLAHAARPLAVDDTQARHAGSKAFVQEPLNARQRLVQRLAAQLDLLEDDGRRRR